MSNTVVVNVQANTEVATANITKTTVAVDNLTKANQKLNNETEQVASGFEDVTKNGGAIAILDQLTGGLASRVRDTYEATKLFNFSLKAMRTALIATGIGALVVALGLVVAYWDDIVEFIGGANAKLQKQLDLKNEYIGDLDHELAVMKAQQELAKAQGGFNKELAAQQRAKLKDLLTERKLAVELLELQLQNLRHRDYEEYLEVHKKFETAKLEVIKTEIALQNSWNEVTEKAKVKREAEAEAEKKATQERKRIRTEALALEEEIRKGQINTQKELRDEELLQVELKYEELLKKARAYYGEESEQAVELLTTKQEKILALESKFAEEDSLRKKEIDDQKKADQLADDQDEINRIQDIADEKKRIAEEEADFQQKKDTAIAISKANMQNILTGLEESGIKKSKSGQAIYKAIALTQIGLDSAIAISKASALANAEGVAAQTAFPLVPGIGTIARVLSYASTVAQVGSNISRAKQLLSGGGSSSVSAGDSSAPRQATGTAQQPQFNIVGQGEGSQIASALGEQQQTPVQAFVVSQDVTTAQSLENGIIQGATLGG